MYSKKGQFYLIAAIIIIGVFMGVIGLTNYISVGETQTLESKKNQLLIEKEEVLDYVSFQNSDFNSTNFMINFTNAFYSTNKGINAIFIFGTESNLQSFRRTEIGLSVKQLGVSEGNLSVEFDEKDYSFEINEGYNFYFILSEEINNQKEVIVG